MLYSEPYFFLGGSHDRLDVVDINERSISTSRRFFARNLVGFTFRKVKVSHDTIASKGSTMLARMKVAAAAYLHVVKVLEVVFVGRTTNEALLQEGVVG